MKISIVISTHNRSGYLKRSLECYARQPYRDFEIILLDDDSDDHLAKLCKTYAPTIGLDLKYFWFKRSGEFYPRSHTALINWGVRAADGDLIITTAPEVMPGKTTLTEIVELAKSGGRNFYNARPYLLTRQEQLQLDTVDWIGIGPSAAVRLIPGFYDSPPADHTGCPEYQHRRVDTEPVFHTDMFGGMDRKTWRLIGGHPECEVWGAEDPSFYAERVRLGIADITLNLPHSTVVHQNHDGPDDFKFERNPQRGLANVVHGPWDHIRW